MDFDDLVEIRPGRRIRLVSRNADRGVDEGGPCVMFLHGSMATLDQFAMQIDFVRPRAAVVAYDALGCGASEKPVPHTSCCGSDSAGNPYSEDDMVSDALAVLEREVLARKRRPVILVAHSFGTAVALRLAGTARVQKAAGCLVLLGASQAKPAGASHPVFALPECILDGLLRPMMNEAFVRAAFHPSSDPALAAAARRASGTNPMHVIRPFYRSMRWAIHEPVEGEEAAEERLGPFGAAKTAMLVFVTGVGDGLTPTASALALAQECAGRGGGRVCRATLSDLDSGEATRGTIRSTIHEAGRTQNVAFFDVERAAHMVALERPQLVNDILDDVLTRLLIFEGEVVRS
jgi:pimeloyl-ACP methyl ester carboxylesterase